VWRGVGQPQGKKGGAKSWGRRKGPNLKSGLKKVPLCVQRHNFRRFTKRMLKTKAKKKEDRMKKGGKLPREKKLNS